MVQYDFIGARSAAGSTRTSCQEKAEPRLEKKLISANEDGLQLPLGKGFAHTRQALLQQLCALATRKRPDLMNESVQ